MRKRFGCGGESAVQRRRIAAESPAKRSHLAARTMRCTARRGTAISMRAARVADRAAKFVDWPARQPGRLSRRLPMMAPKDLLLALIVILAWGVNFVVIKVGLHGMPPMLLGALRFTLAAVPAVFFVRRPQIPWRMLILYGATIQLGQFVFLFTGMYVGMPAGLASLVLQSQAFFTLVFAMLFSASGCAPRTSRARDRRGRARRDRGRAAPR
jgi:O-acetylserine/cysteine efflux transporter